MLLLIAISSISNAQSVAGNNALQFSTSSIKFGRVGPSKATSTKIKIKNNACTAVAVTANIHYSFNNSNEVIEGTFPGQKVYGTNLYIIKAGETVEVVLKLIIKNELKPISKNMLVTFYYESDFRLANGVQYHPAVYDPTVW